MKGALTGLMTAALGGGNACWKTALVASMHANSVSKAGATLEDLAGDITHYPPEDVKFEEKEAEKLAIEDGWTSNLYQNRTIFIIFAQNLCFEASIFIFYRIETRRES